VVLFYCGPSELRINKKDKLFEVNLYLLKTAQIDSLQAIQIGMFLSGHKMFYLNNNYVL
jgi:hypothetical protein